jgi:putative addiction module component (TIGR02574 family)
MAATMSALGIDQMSVEDRLTLIGEIWDSIAATPDRIPLTEEQRQELDRRLAAYKADPSKVTPWEVVKAEALERMKK